MIEILADASDSTLLKDVGQATSMISGFGFAVWYAWFMTASRIPAIEKSHSDQLTESEKRHEAHIALLINNFRADQTAMWVIKREDDQKLSQAIEKLASAIEDQECRYNASRP